jgi:hypothetical protein
MISTPQGLSSKCKGLVLSFFLLFWTGIGINCQTTLLWNKTNGSSLQSNGSFVQCDLLGNIYVASAAYDNGNSDWIVSSFTPDSLQRWTINIDGNVSDDDFPAAIAVDSAFNIYVAGTITNSTGRDIALIALDSAGNLKWNSDYDRMNGSDDVCIDLKLASEGVAVVGYSNMTNGNYDFSCLVYTVDGILNWSRHYNSASNGNDYATAAVLKSNGDICITGNTIANNGISAMSTICYDETGVLKWSSTYSYKNGFSDYANDIGVNSSQDVIVIGQGYASNTNSDAIVIKYGGSDGVQRWATAYSGSFSGHDYASSLVMDAGNYFFVTGTTQTSTSNTDYFMIKYRGNGQVTWAQTYNGSGDSQDVATGIEHDGDDIVVTGNSTGNGTGLDATTISLNKGTGVVNWIYRLNAPGSIADISFNLCRDDMGNIIVAGNVQTQNNSYVNTVFKINQAVKNSQAIEEHLKILAFGLETIANDSMSKNVLYSLAGLVVDTFNVALYNTFLNKCDALGYTTRAIVRGAIQDQLNWNSDSPAEWVIAERIRDGVKKRAALAYIPAYYNYTQNSFVSTSLTLAYSYLQTDFPIYSVPSSDPIFEQDVLATPTVVMISRPLLFWNKNSPGLRYCYAMRNDDVFNNCSVCGGYTAPDGLPSANSCGATQSHEVGIDIGYYYWGSCNVQGGVEECLRQIDLNTGSDVTLYPQYALLQAMPGFQYFERIGSGDYIKVKKMTYPIFHVSQQQYGVSMTLCGGDNGASFKKFNDYHGGNPGDYTEDFALGWGGIYKVSRPGTGQRPVYFTLPFAQFLRYDQGPDLNFYYGTNVLNYCSNGSKEITEDYFIGTCEICSTTQSVFGLAQNAMADILITTDYATISNFWSDNVIVVGVHNNNAIVAPGNFVTFSANAIPTSCSPSTYNLASSNPICSQTVLSDNSYEVRSLFNGNVLFQPGDNLLVHVTASFLNGETINSCQPIALVNGQNNLSGITVEIRGNIKDYDANAVNYKIDIYELQ